jgi:hypothetical protein
MVMILQFRHVVATTTIQDRLINRGPAPGEHVTDDGASRIRCSFAVRRVE